MDDDFHIDPLVAQAMARVLDGVRIKPRQKPSSGKRTPEGWRVITVSLPPDIVDELDRISGHQMGTMRGHLIERAVRLFLFLKGCGRRWLRGDKTKE